MIVAVDAYLRRMGDRGLRVRQGLAVASLAVLLGAVWAADFSYLSVRSSDPSWPQLVAGFQRRCDQQPSPAAWQRLPPMDWIRMPPLLPCALVRPAPPRPPAAERGGSPVMCAVGPGRLSGGGQLS